LQLGTLLLRNREGETIPVERVGFVMQPREVVAARGPWYQPGVLALEVCKALFRRSELLVVLRDLLGEELLSLLRTLL